MIDVERMRLRLSRFVGLSDVVDSDAVVLDPRWRTATELRVRRVARSAFVRLRIKGHESVQFDIDGQQFDALVARPVRCQRRL